MIDIKNNKYIKIVIGIVVVLLAFWYISIYNKISQSLITGTYYCESTSSEGLPEYLYTVFDSSDPDNCILTFYVFQYYKGTSPEDGVVPAYSFKTTYKMSLRNWNRIIGPFSYEPVYKVYGTSPIGSNLVSLYADDPTEEGKDMYYHDLNIMIDENTTYSGYIEHFENKIIMDGIEMKQVPSIPSDLNYIFSE